MRITAIEIENFKGIGKRIRVELAPITLLFGANCAGKSTVLHALLYLKDVLERRNLDAITTPASGIALELGGFRQFVHGRDLSNTVRIRVEMAVTGEELPEMAPHYDGPDWAVSEEEAKKSEEFDQAEDQILKSVQAVMLEIEVCWDAATQKPVANAYSVWLNRVLLCRIERSAKPLIYSRFEIQHPAFSKRISLMASKQTGIDLDGVAHDIPQLSFIFPAFRDKPFYHGIRAWFPEMQDPIPDFSFRGTLKLPALDWDQYGDNDPELAKSIAWNSTALLARLIIGPGRLVKEWLNDLRYIGPLRARPPREGIPEAVLGDWAEGLAAWKSLEQMSPDSLEEVNDWLADRDRLNTGYAFERSRRVDVDADLFKIILEGKGRPKKTQLRGLLRYNQVREKTKLVQIMSGMDLAPSEVGVGLSQVIPVVVASLVSSNGLIAIEQPELHIHPAMQVALGDLFIESAQKRGTQFLIETHSEHLILRLLRRIREAGEQKPDAPYPSLKPEDVAVIWVESTLDGIQMTRIPIDETGEFTQPWPKGFFEERAGELF